MIIVFQNRTRHPTVAMATKMDKNEQGTTGTKAKQVRDRLNEKTVKNQSSVYLKVFIRYSWLKSPKIIQKNLPIHTKNRIRECFKENRAMKTSKTLNSGKGRKIVRIQKRNSLETLTEEVTETTFQRTMTTQRTPNKSHSDNSDSDEMPQMEWRAMNRYIQTNTGNSGPSTSTVATAQPALVSFWELIGAERDDKPRSMMELEAIFSMQSPRTLLENKTRDEVRIGQVVEVDLTGENIEDREFSPEVSVVTPRETKRVGHRSRKN